MIALRLEYSIWNPTVCVCLDNIESFKTNVIQTKSAYLSIAKVACFQIYTYLYIFFDILFSIK